MNERRYNVLRQLRSLLEFTRDIDRNQDDWLFSNEDGNICYIFDENVLECFINPVPHYVRIFDPREPFDWQISIQAALVASEYLVTTRLPGEKEKRIYLTEWHFEELDNRIGDLVRTTKESLTLGEGIGSATHFFKQCDVSTLSSLEAADEVTRKDYESLYHQLSSEHNAKLVRFLFARNAAAFLTQKDPITQAQQLHRLMSSDITTSLAPLSGHPQLQNMTEADDNQLRKNAREWQRRLEAEFIRKIIEFLPQITLEDLRSASSGMQIGSAERGTVNSQLGALHERIQKGAWSPPSRWDDTSLINQVVLSALERRYGRSAGSLRNDARSLAFVLWAAKKRAAKDQRFALITGDRVMFDAYRRWYISQPEGEPFILRRISQYAPIINLGDAPTDVVGQATFFSQIRSGVETALLALTLAGHIGRDEKIRTREHFALTLSDLKEVKDLQKFASDLDDKWVRNNGKAFDQVVERWGEVERFSIGVNYDLIDNRYKSICQNEPSWQSFEEEAMPDVYAEYLENILRKICEGSAAIFFPFAENFIRLAISTEYKGDESYEARVPIALHLFIPGKNEVAVSLDKLLSQWRDKRTLSEFLDARINKTLPEKPALVFAIAAAVALRSSRWQDAERFSDVAARKMLVLSELDINEEDAEYLYLRAVAKRFTMGNLAPWRSGARDDVWRRSLSIIVKILTRCEEHHLGREQPFRVLRAVSERAAARLFYAAWVVMTPDNEIVLRKLDYKKGIAQLGYAIEELRACVEQARGFHCRPNQREMQDRLLPRIERQFMTNFASAQTLVHLFRKRSSKKKQLMPAEICLSVGEVGRVADWIAKSEPSQEWRPHPAARGDHLAFCALELGKQDAVVGLKHLAKEGANFSLAIDQQLIVVLDRVARGGYPDDWSTETQG